MAAIHCRPAGVEFFAHRLDAIDLSFGGLRIACDDEYQVGALLEIDVFFEGSQATVTAEIVWVRGLDLGSPARFDVGLVFVELSPDAMRLLFRALGSTRDAPALSRTPIRIVDDAGLRAAPLDGRMGFLISLIDGATSVESLIDLSGMPADETLALLEDLRMRRIVDLW